MDFESIEEYDHAMYMQADYEQRADIEEYEHNQIEEQELENEIRKEKYQNAMYEVQCIEDEISDLENRILSLKEKIGYLMSQDF